MKKFLKEFKEFAVKGNVIDMAVGVIIGGAFSKIVSSLVNDILMPAFSVVLGNLNIQDLKVVIATADPEAPIQILYGVFLQNVIDFIIIALCIFMAIRLINSFKKKEETKEAPAPVISKEEILLTEIRDLLKEKR
ncbi:MAG: large-conductance mechanosensitive channel protein MscL [Erysipelotrichaceae bacterium]|nr:large-conductance mechanosensitive channel protein MscL [Erysipelotrichaceae bacterium]